MLLNDTQIAYGSNLLPTAPASATGDVVAAPGTVIAASGPVGPSFNAKGRGAMVYVNVTAVAGAGTIVAKLQAQDVASGLWVDIVGASNAVTSGVSVGTFIVHPDLTAAANTIVKMVMPDTYRVYATIGGTSVTCSIGVNYLA